MKAYGKYIRPYWSYFILAPLLMIIEVAGDVYLPKKLANIINIGAANKDIDYILKTGGVMLGIIVIMIIGGIGSAYFATKGSVFFAADLRKDIFKRVQQFSFSNIDSFSTGSLVTRLINDVTQMQNLVMISLRLAFRAPGMLIGSLVMVLLLDTKLAVVLLVIIPVLAIIIGFILKLALPRFSWLQKRVDRINVVLQEAMTNIRVTKSFVREDYEQERFDEANNELKKATVDAYKLVVVLIPLMMFIMQLCTIAVVWYGGNRIIAGEMDVGVLVAFTTYIVQVLMSLMMLATVLMQFSRAKACSQRIKEVLETVPDISDSDAQQPNKQILKGEIEFKDVKFSYYKNSEESVLEDINLKIEPGQAVGIIGSTGCGKSTLVSLIPRLYDVDNGEVLIDGVNVKDYSLFNLREGVGMVLQKNVLFSGSVKENILWGDENATDEEIKSVLESAQALRFVDDMENGIETQLGQEGSNVSGGQKQRLCIARALLKKPKILILDDSTSAVDMATEARIRNALNTSLKETTKLIIAQRISSVEKADVIFVMDDGKIVSSGTHDKLLETCETYKEIYESQVKKEASAS